MYIFVAGLPYDLDDAELEEIFEKFGTVKSARVTLDRETGKSRGFGFVEMPNTDEANDAIENLNDISLGKKPLVVKAAEERSIPGGGSSGPRRSSDGGGGGHVGGYRVGGGNYNRDRNEGGGSGGYNRDRNDGSGRSGGGGYRDRNDGGGRSGGGYNNDRDRNRY